MASRNADSMTNAQGEFHPSKPRDEPLTKKGHQPGREGEADVFHAQVLPPGTAPASRTFQPNPVSETPGQANNPDALGSDDKENTSSDPLDFPGATSKDVHMGLGVPGAGQTSSSLHHDGQNKRERAPAGLAGQAQGGSGLRDEGSAEGRRLQQDHVSGPANAREHNATLSGAADQEPVSAEAVAAERN